MKRHFIPDSSKARLIKDIRRAELLAARLDVSLIEWEGMLVLEDFRFFHDTVTDRQYAKVCNGAGPKGAGYLVPDSMWGLNMTIVFDGHDFGYDKFTCKYGKELSDLLMKINMILYIDRHTTRCPFMRSTLLFLREHRAMKYYYAVHLAGEWFYPKEK